MYNDEHNRYINYTSELEEQLRMQPRGTPEYWRLQGMLTQLERQENERLRRVIPRLNAMAAQERMAEQARLAAEANARQKAANYEKYRAERNARFAQPAHIESAPQQGRRYGGIASLRKQ